jgi:hypothetical protein
VRPHFPCASVPPAATVALTSRASHTVPNSSRSRRKRSGARRPAKPRRSRPRASKSRSSASSSRDSSRGRTATSR